MPRSTLCEAKRGSAWGPMDIRAALDHRTTVPMRCPECHGQVRPHKMGTTGQAEHFEHMMAHIGCSFSAQWDGRSPSRTPGTANLD